jgi:hypothetical protein
MPSPVRARHSQRQPHGAITADRSAERELSRCSPGRWARQRTHGGPRTETLPIPRTPVQAPTRAAHAVGGCKGWRTPRILLPARECNSSANTVWQGLSDHRSRWNRAYHRHRKSPIRDGPGCGRPQGLHLLQRCAHCQAPAQDRSCACHSGRPDLVRVAAVTLPRRRFLTNPARRSCQSAMSAFNSSGVIIGLATLMIRICCRNQSL